MAQQGTHEEHMERAIATMQAQIVTLTEQLQTSSDEVARVREHARLSHDRLAKQIEDTLEGSNFGEARGGHMSKPMRLVDPRSCSPGKFAGGRDKWRDFSSAVKAYCNAMYPGFRDALDWAERETMPIDKDSLVAISWQHATEANTHLFEMLLLHCEGEPRILIQNGSTGTSQGFEAWRILSKQYDGTNMHNEISRVQQLMHVPRVKTLEELPSSIAAWERAWAQYIDRTGEKLPERWKVSILMSMMPITHEREIQTRYVGQDIKYDVLLNHINSWVSVQQARNGPMPMDTSSLALATLAEAEGMSTEELEQAILVLRQKGGGKKGLGKNGKKGAGRGNGGKKGAAKGAAKATLTGVLLGLQPDRSPPGQMSKEPSWCSFSRRRRRGRCRRRE